MAKLIIFQDVEDEEPVFEDFELILQRLLIGSGPDNDLVLESPNIDPTHASMELRNEYWVLQDLGGPGGTAVNGMEIAGPFHLHSGDLIELGGIKLKFEESEEVSEGESSLGRQASPPGTTPLRGRIWFAVAAGYTLAVIFIIIFLLVVADFLGVIRVADLLPFWSG